MTDATTDASARQEHLQTLREAITSVEQEARSDGATRTVALALDVAELIIRSQQERLHKIEDATSTGTEIKGFSSMRQEHLKHSKIRSKISKVRLVEVEHLIQSQ